MDLELRDYLDAKFAGVDGKFAELRTEMRTEFRSGMDALRAEMDTRFAAVDAEFESVRADLERLETRLLTAFHSWASPMEGRVRDMSKLALGSAERLGMLEDRVSAIERRLGLPPL
ncbi:MAG TPA: hypothetical protein VEF06_04340 [Bryobacteraceae bacterium]|nr:hypothetical protein [Bryobacteraceae bacterium]